MNKEISVQTLFKFYSRTVQFQLNMKDCFTGTIESIQKNKQQLESLSKDHGGVMFESLQTGINELQKLQADTDNQIAKTKTVIADLTILFETEGEIQ